MKLLSRRGEKRKEKEKKKVKEYDFPALAVASLLRGSLGHESVRKQYRE